MTKRTLRAPLTAAAAILTLLVSAGGAEAQTTLAIDQAPDQVRVGETFDIVWTIRAPRNVLQTTVIFGPSSRGWNDYGDILSGPPGTFRNRLQAPSQPGRIYYTVYVNTGEVRGIGAERVIEVLPASAAQPFGIDRRPAAARLNFPLEGARPGSLRRIRAFPNLRFNQPVFLTHAPDNSDRIFVVEKAGRILVFPNRDNVTASSAQVFLDIRNQVWPEGEQGLLGLAFDPDFARNGEFYVYYSSGGPRGGQRRSVVSRFDSNGSAASRGSEEIILQVAQPFSNHNAGMIAFGPDNLLYIAFGDGGSGGDPQNNGQNVRSLLGTILRVEPRGRRTYAIPADNPFAGAGNGVRGEIFAYGLRNPWRFSFDRATGELWCADVGQNAIEEINIIRRGGNYGWRVFEGSRRYSSSTQLVGGNSVGPVFEYNTNVGKSITGGYVYRGNNPRLRSIQGAYLYGDYVSGRVFALVARSGQAVSNTEVTRVSQLVSFGEDQSGELFAVSLGGEVYRFEEQTVSGGQFPRTLSATGLFRSTADLIPSGGVIEYEVNSPLWSDNATKRRWIALPDGGRIGFSATDNWSFPVGTVVVKHFELEMRVGVPSSARRLETRVFVRQREDWEGVTYKWNDSQTDAVLLEGGEAEQFLIRDASAPGGQRVQTWQYPSRGQCFSCHTEASGIVLGVRTRQLNRSARYASGVTDNQLRTLNHIGMFNRNIGEAERYEALPDPKGDEGTVAERARSYLAANCAHCHQPGGPAVGSMDMRYGATRAGLNLINVRPSSGSLGLPNAFRILAGDRNSSVLFQRMGRLDDERMPSLGSNVVDGEALELIGRWIDQGAR